MPGCWCKNKNLILKTGESVQKMLSFFMFFIICLSVPVELYPEDVLPFPGNGE
jgi:hypothetical protein